MIEIAAEQLLSLKDAARRLPGRLHYSTIFRWATTGTRYGRLETVVIGGQRYTSIEALQRFAESSTRAANGENPSTVTSKSRRAAIEKAEREFDELVGA